MPDLDGESWCGDPAGQSAEIVVRSHPAGFTATSESPAGLAPDLTPQLKILQLVECWEFVRGCLSCWLRDACPEFRVSASTDLNRSDAPSYMNRVAAIVLGEGMLRRETKWLEEDLAWLRQRRPDLPVVAILPADMLAKAEYWRKRLGLRGYIPAFTSTEVASAALRLVIAGGRYFPRACAPGWAKHHSLVGSVPELLGKDLAAKLTPRERAVLDLLSQGNPNKIIAHELNMSLSTVKAHVHSIIQKLNVRNRTEVAVAVRTMEAAIAC